MKKTIFRRLQEMIDTFEDSREIKYDKFMYDEVKMKKEDEFRPFNVEISGIIDKKKLYPFHVEWMSGDGYFTRSFFLTRKEAQLQVKHLNTLGRWNSGVLQSLYFKKKGDL
jgi:hypothetical protein